MCRSHWCKEKWSHYSNFDRNWYRQKHSKVMIACFWKGRCANLPHTINRSTASPVAEHIGANEMWWLLVTVLLSLMQTCNHRQHDASKGHELKMTDKLALHLSCSSTDICPVIQPPLAFYRMKQTPLCCHLYPKCYYLSLLHTRVFFLHVSLICF